MGGSLMGGCELHLRDRAAKSQVRTKLVRLNMLERSRIEPLV